MYRKVLIPMDGSPEAEGVFPMVEDQLAPDAEVILLRVIPRARSTVIGGQLLDSTQIELEERENALTYCRLFVDRLGSDVRQRCEVRVSESVPDGIVDAAIDEEVDLIAMYTHDRTGLARIIRGSVAEKVRGKAPMEAPSTLRCISPTSWPADAVDGRALEAVCTRGR